MTLEIIIAIVTFLTSVSSSMFIAGMKWGQVSTRLDFMSDRLAKIEGMFTLTPKFTLTQKDFPHGD